MVVVADATAEAIDPDLDEVPGVEVHAFIRSFCEIYTARRHGARYLVTRQKDVPTIRKLLRVYDRPRLEKMTAVLMMTDDEWIARTDRGIGILFTKASWLDAKIAEYEAQHGPIKVAS